MDRSEWRPMSNAVDAPVVDPDLPSLATISRLKRFFMVDPRFAMYHAEQWIVRKMAHSGLLFTRIALGIVFLWFGAMKLLPTVLPIDLLAEHILTTITFHRFSPEVCLHVLGTFECLIGLGFLTGKFLRFTVFLLALQMPGTFLPLLLMRHDTWVHFPYLPTFMGQYIIKNFVLIAAGIIVGSTVRGGLIIAHPEIAAKAARVEALVETRQFREREKRANEN